jgi:hypothetical protein
MSTTDHPPRTSDHPLFRHHSFRRKGDDTDNIKTFYVDTDKGTVKLTARSVGEANKMALAHKPGAKRLGTRGG